MAEPVANGVHFDSSFKEVNGRAASPNMRGDVSPLTVGPHLHDLPRVTPNDFVNSKAGQRGAIATSKDRPVGSFGGTVLLQQSLQQGCCLLPQGTDSPLIALAMHVNQGIRTILNVVRPKVGYFLHARPAVLKE